jgi:hypothetical protein
MYKPVINSVVKYLKSINADIEIDHRYDCYRFEEIRPEEDVIFIWIGIGGIPDLGSVKRRGIYTIYYNTEPYCDGFCCDEIWTYSKYMFHYYNKGDQQQIIRFVPICEENGVKKVPYGGDSKGAQMKLTFIGWLCNRQDKYERLLCDPIIKENLEEKSDLWNDEDYNNYIGGRANIYLNLMKSGSHVLPTVRINKLLSHGCIIISERTNPEDEEHYEGLVQFCELDEIGKLYDNLLKKTGAELQEQSDEIYRKFSDKFHETRFAHLVLRS